MPDVEVYNHLSNSHRYGHSGQLVLTPKQLLMKILATTPIIILLLCLTSICKAQEEMKYSIDSMLLSYNLQGKFNGNVLLETGGNTILHKSYGYSDIENKTPLDTLSLFCIASISKIFTSTAIMLLDSEGVIDIDKPLTRYLSGLPEIYDSVKIRHLLAHISGIPEMNQDWRTKTGRRNSDVYEFVSQQKKLESEPGSEYSYSNTGYNLLAMIIDSVSGSSYKEFIESRLLRPLGMHNSYVFPPAGDKEISSLVKSYNYGVQADWPLYTYGSSGIYSTTGDMAIWDKSFFNNRITDKQTMDNMLRPVILSNGKKTNYGLGWGVINLGNTTIAGHTGGMFGFRTMYEREIEKNLTLIIFSNTGDSSPLMEIRGKILDIVDKYSYDK